MDPTGGTGTGTGARAADSSRRIQRRRRRGWRMPPGAVYVGRPTTWGNPFRVTRSSDYHGLSGSWFVLDEAGTTYHPEHDSQTSARQLAVDLYAHTVATARPDSPLHASRIREALGGRDLVCWCPISQPCHADVLLAVANRAGEDLPVENGRRPAADPADAPTPDQAGARTDPTVRQVRSNGEG